MQRRDLIIGIVVLIGIAAVVFFIQNRQPDVTPIDTTPTPNIEDRVKDIEDNFKVDIPDNVEKASLEGTKGSGIATRDSQEAGSAFTILADLPDPAAGHFYQAWLRVNGNLESLGMLRVAKGGYLLDARLKASQASSNDVVITLESKLDSTPETVVLQGSF